MLTINKKNALAVALMAGLGMAGTAGAFTLTTAGDTVAVYVATADIIGATTDIGINETFEVALTGSDNILGRTTGFTIRYTLNNGATFGDQLDTGDLAVGAAAYGAVATNAWIPTIAAGGGTADNYVVILFSPPVAPIGAYGLTVGNLLSINDADLVVGPTTGTDAGQILDTLTALQSSGQSVAASVQFIDPVTATLIMQAQSLIILTSGDPIVLACDAGDGDQAKTIDVGVTSQAAKTWFSSDGTIGGGDAFYMNLGSITVSIDPLFSSFAYAGTDQFVTTVSGDFSAFAGANGDVFLSDNGSCDVTDVSGVIDNANGTVTFTYTGSDMGDFSSTGFTAFVCAEVVGGNTTVIDAGAVSVTTTFTRGAVSSDSSSCTLLPLRYNGSVVDIYHVNPAGNSTAQSFIRVINPSDTDGTVTLEGIDDSGANAAGPITFTLGARKSMQINSEDLEAGNAAKGLTGAWGDGAGKWRGTVTGEFPNMLVQSLNRNANDGTVTNLTDADNQGEQVWNELFNQGGGFF